MGFSEGLTQAQLDMRRLGITASDAVVLSGSSNWGHPLEVWEQKMGAPPITQTLAMAMGHAAEPVVMELLAKRFGLTLQAGATVRHRIMDIFIATPDRFVADAPVVIGPDGYMPIRGIPEATCEGKLVGWHLVKEWHDESDPTGKTRVFPDSVAVQTCWQMGVTGTRRNYVGALLGGWRDDDVHMLSVDFNEDLWLGLWDVCERFWVDHVLTRIPPSPDASDRAAEALGRIYPKIARPVLEPASDGEVQQMIRYMQINANLRALTEEKQAIANALRARIGDAEGLRSSEFKVTWRPQNGSVSAVKMAAHYQLADLDLDPFRGDPMRVLRVAPINKKDKAYDDSIRNLIAT